MVPTKDLPKVKSVNEKSLRTIVRELGIFHIHEKRGGLVLI